MIRKLFLATVGSLVLATGAHATTSVPTVLLLAPDQVLAGELFHIDMIIDFGALGVNFVESELLFDSAALSLVSFDFPLPNTDIGISCPGGGGCTDDPGVLGVAVFGSGFPGNLIDTGGPDTNQVLALRLQMLAADVLVPTIVDLGLSRNCLFCAFLTAEFDDITSSVTLTGTQVQINPAVVPVPAAVWLMIGGLGALFRFRRS